MKFKRLRIRKMTYLSAVLSVLLIFAVVYIYYAAYNSYVQNEQEITETRFLEISSAARSQMLSYFDKAGADVEGTGRELSYLGSDEGAVSRFFEKRFEETQAVSGLLILSDGTLAYGSEEYAELFAETINDARTVDGSVISNLVDSKAGAKCYAIAAPCDTKDGKAVVALIYPQLVLSSQITSASFSTTGRLCIIDSSGRFIARQTKDDPWLEEGEYKADGSLQNRLIEITSNLNGKKYEAYIKPLGINDWFIAYIVPSTVIEQQLQIGSNRVHIFGTLCIVIGIILVSVGFYKNERRLRSIRLFKLKFKIATSQSARAAFQYEKRRDRLSLISECEHISLPKQAMSLSELANLVHPADRGFYGQSVIELRRNGTSSATVRLAQVGGTDTYRWYYVTATRLKDRGEGRAITIGTVEDIDEREKERLTLSEKATTDCLTGLSNRSEAEKMISERLQRLDANEHSSFAIIDLDDFKNINDAYGHACGDRALIFFAEKLKATFRFGDVIGRLGGDEFVVYMTLTSDKRVIERRIQELMESLTLKRAEDNMVLPEITCSVGCCVAAKGDTFETLYHRADNALYTSKTNGKGLSTIA